MENNKKLKNFIKTTITEFLNEQHKKFDRVDWSYGKENREEGYFRFYINDSDYPINKRQILSKYVNNTKLKNYLESIEKERDSINGVFGSFFISDFDIKFK